MSKTIPPLDLMWLAMETSAAPTHVGALMLFEKPKGRPRVVREIVDAYRAVRPTPPFNYVPDLGGGVPRFHETTDYDPRYHVQYIAMPGDASYDDILRVVTDLHEPMLDRAGMPVAVISMVGAVGKMSDDPAQAPAQALLELTDRLSLLGAHHGIDRDRIISRVQRDSRPRRR